MDEDVTKLLNNPRLLYSVALFLSFVFIIATIDIYNSVGDVTPEYNLDSTNHYKDLTYLGQTPNSPAREPDAGDIDTGVTGYVGGQPVKLYASRTWANNDYGKTFLWGIN